MTPQARSGVQFELRRFEALPASGAVVVLLLEGRFRQSTRFGRQPVLVIEPGEDERRIELSPVRTVADGHRWEAAYAAPAEALTADARLALGIRGTLLELPAPDEPDDGERVTALAREANQLRRALEAAEHDAATARTALAETTSSLTAAEERATAAETRAEEALAATAAAEARATAAEERAEEASAATAAAEDRATAAEARAEEAAAATAAAEERAEEALAATAAAEERATAAEERAEEASAAATAAEERAEEALAATAAAEDRAAAAEARADEAPPADATEAALTAEMASLVDAQARAADAEQELKVAKEGIEVLRAELAEERERSQVVIAELEQQLDALRDEDRDPTRPFTVAEERDADDDAPRRAPREATLRDLIPPADGADKPTGPHPGRWVALAALVLFAFVLLGLLLGFLA